jgi:hypothetical protein
MNIMIPDDLVKVVSFRNILSILEQIARRLPTDNDQCLITLELAKDWVKEEFNFDFDTDEQEDFLEILLKSFSGAKGIWNGLTTEELFMNARKIGFDDIDIFYEEIIEPFVRMEILVSGGIPDLDENGRFIRWPEPYYPSVSTLINASLYAN